LELYLTSLILLKLDSITNYSSSYQEFFSIKQCSSTFLIDMIMWLLHPWGLVSINVVYFCIITDDLQAFSLSPHRCRSWAVTELCLPHSTCPAELWLARNCPSQFGSCHHLLSENWQWVTFNYYYVSAATAAEHLATTAEHLATTVEHPATAVGHLATAVEHLATAVEL